MAAAIRNLGCWDRTLTRFTFRCLDSMADIGRDDWQRLYQSNTEGYDYFVACETAPAPTFVYSAVGVFDGDHLVAGGPLFRTAFDPGLVLDGNVKSVFNFVSRALPSISRVTIIGFGSPHSQESTLAFDARLSPNERREALVALSNGIEFLARQTQSQIILFKDIGADLAAWGDDILQTAGYRRAVALPVATLAVPQTEDDYFKSLSANMRSNLRRRLKRAQGVRIEIRNTSDGLSDQLYQLRRSTMQRAAVDYAQFAETGPGFYEAVLAGMRDQAQLLTYWRDDELIGFTMVLLGPDQLIQNYNGMRYPEGPDNGLFYLDWMTQLRLCMERGIGEMQSGVTTYLIKARLGSQFHRSYLYVRHRYGAINTIVGRLVPTINLEHTDPGLLELGDRAPFA